jgi:hypothetical protein
MFLENIEAITKKIITWELVSRIRLLKIVRYGLKPRDLIVSSSLVLIHLLLVYRLCRVRWKYCGNSFLIAASRRHFQDEVVKSFSADVAITGKHHQ